MGSWAEQELPASAPRKYWPVLASAVHASLPNTAVVPVVVPVVVWVVVTDVESVGNSAVVLCHSSAFKTVPSPSLIMNEPDFIAASNADAARAKDPVGLFGYAINVRITLPLVSLTHMILVSISLACSILLLTCLVLERPAAM